MTAGEFLRSGLPEKVAELSAAAEEVARESQDALVSPVAFSSKPLTKIPFEGGNLLDKAHEYKRFLQRRFSVSTAMGPCTVYPQLAAQHRARITWSGRFNQSEKSARVLFTFALRLTLARLIPFGHYYGGGENGVEIVSFETAHGFSEKAAVSLKRGWLWSYLSDIISDLVKILFGLGLVYSSVILIITLSADYLAPGEREELHWAIYVLLGTCTLGAIIWGLIVLSKKLRLPPALRCLEKRPLRATKITWDY